MPKRTHQPKNRKRQRTHGWLTRMSSRSGRRIIKRRRLKNRKTVSA